MSENKSIKDYCKDAKKRLKNGYWENYQKELKESIENGEKNGVSKSRIIEIYSEKAHQLIKNENSDDEFYSKVKEILEKEGEVSDFIGRLTDKTLYETLSYENKQRYIMSLSDRYLKARERYKKECEISK